MYLVLTGIAANATHCGACRMNRDSAAKVLDELRTQLSYDELVELGLAPRRCETCEG